MISFIIPLLVILLSNATTVFIFKKKFSKVIILTLLFFSFPFFLSGILFNSFTIGFIINIIYSISIIFLLLIFRKDKERLKIFKENYFSLGLIAFLIIYIFVFIYDLNRTFTMWDEKSHWGVMLKEMIRLDNFYSIDKSTLLVHKDYPPILQIFELFWIKLCGSYKETYALRSLHTLELSLFILFIDNNKEFNIKNTINTIIKTVLLIIISLLLILSLDIHTIINSIYNDYLLSLLVVYIILFIFFEKELDSNFSLINISIILSFILLTKQVSIAFFLMIIFIYILMIFKDKKRVKQYIKIIIFLIIIPLLFYKIWGTYISNFKMEKQFVISDINLLELKNIIFDTSNEKHIIFTKYMSSIINYKLSWFKLFNITYLNSFIIFTILLFIINKISKLDNKKTIKLFITIFIGALGYLLLMLVLYLFCFGEEGYTLASFDRYMDTYLLIEFIILFILSINYIEKNQKEKIYLILLIIILLIIDKTRFHYLKPILIKPEITNEEIVSNNIVKSTKKYSKIFLLAQDTKAVYQFSVKYYSNPRITNLKNYELPVDDIDYSEYFYKYVNDYMLDYDYLYVVNTTKELNEKYDFIFKNIKNDELYKITNKDGKVKIILIK